MHSERPVLVDGADVIRREGVGLLLNGATTASQTAVKV